MKNVIIIILTVLSIAFLIFAIYQKIKVDNALLLASKQQAQQLQLQKEVSALQIKLANCSDK